LPYINQLYSSKNLIASQTNKKKQTKKKKKLITSTEEAKLSGSFYARQQVLL